MVLRLLGGSVEVASVRGSSYDPGRGAVRRTAGVARWPTTRSRSRRSSRRFRPAPVWRSRRSPAATATTPWSVSRPASSAIADEVVAARVGYLSVSDVPIVVDVVDDLEDAAGRRGLARSSTRPTTSTPRADYRAHLVRVLTARVLAGGRHARPRPDPREGHRMSEELHDVRLRVNGAAHEVQVPARRLLSDALRHDLRPHRHPRRLRARRLRRVHGAGRRPPMRSCLMFAVSAVDAEITTVEGLTEADGSRGGSARSSRRSPTATGSSAASARPASSPRSPPGCAANPRPDATRRRAR